VLCLFPDILTLSHFQRIIAYPCTLILFTRYEHILGELRPSGLLCSG